MPDRLQRLSARRLPNRWLLVAISILLILGIVFRCTNLDRKVYWRDEVATSLVAAGHRYSEVYEQIYDNSIKEARDLQKYLNIRDSDASAIDVVRSLAAEDAQHPPLYFAIAHFWARAFGDSPAAMRSLSVLCSAIALPCLYGLCWELFGSVETGSICVGLASISLFHLMYAQEARPYALWTSVILLSSTALLRALRSHSKKIALDWGLYIFTTILALYTSPLTAFVLLAHGSYTLAIERFRPTKKLLQYCLSAAISLLFFLPWMLVILAPGKEESFATSWLLQDVGIGNLVQGWALNLSYIFVSARPRVYIPILIFIGYAFYFLCARARKEQWLFVCTLFLAQALPLVSIDLFVGGRISISQRYLIPVFLATQLATSYALSENLFLQNALLQKSSRFWRRTWKYFWLLFLTALVLLGVWTSGRFLNTEAGWNKGNANNIPISRTIARSKNPLTIASSDRFSFPSLGNILSLATILDPDTKLLLLDGTTDFAATIRSLEKDFDEIFFFWPSPLLKETLAAQEFPIQNIVKGEFLRLDRSDLSPNDRQQKSTTEIGNRKQGRSRDKDREKMRYDFGMQSVSTEQT